MIEMVYSGKESDEQAEIRLPKNIRQIGANKSSKKIYVEDYVMTQLKKKPANEESVKYGVLLGEIKKSKGHSYIFVKGMIEVREIIENSLIFNDEIWTNIYKDVKRYFENLDIVGWFVSVPYRVKNDMSGIRKIHLDNFAGNDKVCFLSDRTEKEDGFFIYENGNLSKQTGYYIYFEKNEKMKKYIKESTTARKSQTENTSASEKKKPKENSKETTKETTNAKVKLANEQIKNNKEERGENVSLRDMINKNKEESEQQKMGRIAYGISAVLIIALLLSTIVMLNNYGELKNIKQSLKTMNDNQSAQAVNKIIESITTQENGESTKGKENGESTKTKEDESATDAGDQTETSKSEKTTTTEQTSETETTTSADSASGGNSTVDDTDTSGGIYSGSSHTVVAGQTLYDISMKYYGTSDMIDQIKELNGIDDDYKIVEGQKIKLP